MNAKLTAWSLSKWKCRSPLLVMDHGSPPPGRFHLTTSPALAKQAMRGVKRLTALSPCSADHAKVDWSSNCLTISSWRRMNAFCSSPYISGLFTPNRPKSQDASSSIHIVCLLDAQDIFRATQAPHKLSLSSKTCSSMLVTRARIFDNVNREPMYSQFLSRNLTSAGAISS